MMSDAELMAARRKDAYDDTDRTCKEIFGGALEKIVFDAGTITMAPNGRFYSKAHMFALLEQIEASAVLALRRGIGKS